MLPEQKANSVSCRIESPEYTCVESTSRVAPDCPTPAANEPGFTVHAELFQVHIDVPVSPAAEIEEVRWIDPAGDGGLHLAPLTRELILPFYRQSLTTTA